MRPRARITDPTPGRRRAPRRHVRRSRQGMVGHRPCHQRRHQPHRRGGVATGAPRDPERPVPVAELVIRMATGPNPAERACAPGQPTRPETSSPKCQSGTGSATATTPSRSSTSTSDSTRRKPAPDHPVHAMRAPALLLGIPIVLSGAGPGDTSPSSWPCRTSTRSRVVLTYKARDNLFDSPRFLGRGAARGVGCLLGSSYRPLPLTTISQVAGAYVRVRRETLPGHAHQERNPDRRAFPRYLAA